jgi:ribonucrease Y
MDIISLIIGLAAGIVAGLIIMKYVLASANKTKQKQLQIKAKKIIENAINEGESAKKGRMLESKEFHLKKKAEFEETVNRRMRKFDQREQSIKGKEKFISQQLEKVKRSEHEIETIRETLSQQLELVNIKKTELEKHQEEHVRKLEKISKISAEEARDELMESLKEEARTKSMAHIKEIIDEAKMKANKEAKKIVIQTIQRTAAEHTIENTVSIFNLDSDDVKGQIIGREGRNIRAIESATGVEIIVDDTPEAIIISGYDPVRREIARLSLQKLVSDGRIHPARIEEVVKKTSKQIEEQIVEIGERTVIELGIHGLRPELIRMVGRMRFRSSYGQNLLQHSKEVANLCATMAAELGLNTKLAKRAGLLHDIGKVPEEESELSHALLSMKLCEKYGEHPAICNSVGAHHDEVEMQYIISPIIQACDAISGARPGARRETMENYLKRIKELETMAMSFDGVEKAYAMQAGRELRVIVVADSVSDQDSEKISFNLSEKIQDEMQYPGQIKVTVIREKRAVSFAK